MKEKNLKWLIIGLGLVILIVAVLLTSDRFAGESVSNILKSLENFSINLLGKAGPAGKKLETTPLSYKAAVQGDGTSRLGENEFAVLQRSVGKPTGQTYTVGLGLENDRFRNLEVDKSTHLVIFRGSDKVWSYVEAGAEVTVHSLEAGDNSGAKIDQEIRRRLKVEGMVPVVIQFNLPFERFYERGQAASRIKDKQTRFDEVKARLSGLMQGGARIKNDLKIINGVSADVNTASLDALEKSPSVKKVELDKTYQAILDASPSEIGAVDVWQLVDDSNKPLTGLGMRIAIIDTGVDYSHPDLGGCFGLGCKVIGGYDFVNKDNDPMDDQGHGTHVAATAAGRGTLKGVAPDAQVLAYKVLSSSGIGSGSDIISAIDYATDPNRDKNSNDHVDVASMSLGGKGNPDDSVSKAVDNSVAAGVVYTISAGNSGPSASTIGSPGTARTAITVAAACPPHAGLDRNSCKYPIASFSSRGPLIWNDVDLKKPDIAAPGVMICAARWDSAFAGEPTCLDDAHIRISGTSMAAPHLAGAAALVRQAYPAYTPGEVKNFLKATARDLGMTYNDQGAGMVDLKAAIPTTRLKVITNPTGWDATSDPTQKLTTHRQIFSVTSDDATITTVDASIVLDVAGITSSLSKSRLGVAGKGTDTFEATITINNDQTKAGSYSGYILLAGSNGQKTSILIGVTVKPTLAVSPQGLLDYGVDSPSLSTWTSETKTITVTNLRPDVAQTVNIVSSSYERGIKFETPSSLTIPAGGTATFNTRFVVSNRNVENDVYTGTLTLSNAVNYIPRSTKFVKFYVLYIQDTSTEEFTPYAGWMHNRKDWSRNLVFRGKLKTVYLNNPGNYDVMAYYDWTDASGYHEAILFKEGVSVTKGETTLFLNINDAKNTVKIIPTDSAGTATDLHGGKIWFQKYLPNPNLYDEYGVTDLDLYAKTTDYFSDVSGNYKVEYDWSLGRNNQAADKFHYYYRTFTGLNRDITFTNTPSDFKTMKVQMDITKQTLAYPSLWFCHGTICIKTDSRGIAVPSAQTVYSTAPSGIQLFTHRTEGFRLGCPSSGACPHLFESPAFDVSTGERWLSYWKDDVLPNVQDGTIYNGLGPVFWTGKFLNSKAESTSGGKGSRKTGQQYEIRFLPYYFDSRMAIFLRQDYAIPEYDAIPYTLYKDGKAVAQGSIPKYTISPYVNYQGSNAPQSITVNTAGVYEMKLDFPYQIKGQNMAAKVLARFDNSLVDPNPPTITRLYYFAGNSRSELYNPNVPNRLEFDLDAVGGTMGQVTASYSTNGRDFTSLTVTGSGNYAANLPSLSGIAKITIRIEGKDSSANSFTYTFELPSL